MNYIIKPDLLLQMQAAEFTKIQTGDITVYDTAVNTAAEEVRTYLQPEYNLSDEFADLLPYDYTKQYKANSRVYLDAPAYSAVSTYAQNALALQAGVVYKCTTAITTGEPFDANKWQALGAQYTKYYGTSPKPPFDMYAMYRVNDEVYYNGHTYKCLIASTVIGQQGALNYNNTAAIPKGNTFPDDPYYGAQYWQDMGAYSISAGVLPTDTTKWTHGDSRNALLVAHFVAMVIYHMLHRIAPQNIPIHRVERYMGKDEDRAIKDGRTHYPEYSALGWLQAASLDRVSANIEKVQPRQGKRMQWNSAPKTINGY